MSYKHYRGKKHRKFFLLLSVFLLLLVGLLIFLKQSGHIEELERAYQAKEKQLSLLEAEQEKFAYVTNRQIKAGERISSLDVSYEKVYSSMEDSAFAEIGKAYKVSLVDIPPHTQVLDAMVCEEEIDAHVREEEFHVFYLSKNLTDYDTVDIRIFYPNGENYIVLSKKILKGIDQQTASCRLWLDEQETLLISSAIVDAYLIPGTCLYTTKYVESAIQEASVITYTPSKELISLIEKSPNILQQAKLKLSRTVRELLELRTETFVEEKGQEKLLKAFPEFVSRGAGQKDETSMDAEIETKEEEIIYVD